MCFDLASAEMRAVLLGTELSKLKLVDGTTVASEASVPASNGLPGVQPDSSTGGHISAERVGKSIDTLQKMRGWDLCKNRYVEPFFCNPEAIFDKSLDHDEPSDF